jgi:predicted homoserine dehydrogenase-like protein
VIIVDRALEERQAQGKPVRVAMVGAGFMGRGIALQIVNYVPGMRLVAIANRHIAEARRAYLEAGVSAEAIRAGETLAQLEAAIEAGQPAITDDPLLLCQAGLVEAVIEVTGTVELGARVALTAIENGKHVILMNAELDGTVGPILKVYADRAGVIITNADGDQPGVTLNLYRFVRGLGVKPVLCGNIKGLHDPYRNPTTQEGFARRWGQRPSMVTSFADGTKISFEQAIVANATGMRVARRGMWGPTVPAGTALQEAVKTFPVEAILNGPGLVDYLVGAEPSPGVFVLGTHDHPRQRHYLNLYKLGQGPLYCFYTPYHLCHFEVPNTVARAVLLGDAAIAPKAGPCVDVIATAKIDLAAGQILDGMGEYLTYGLAENSGVMRAENLLPIGLAEGCRLVRSVPKDQALSFEDVMVPDGRLSDRLWAEQNAHFGLSVRRPTATEPLTNLMQA